jgi:hypothetical protein
MKQKIHKTLILKLADAEEWRVVIQYYNKKKVDIAAENIDMALYIINYLSAYLVFSK